jgi:hypothetical protein
VEPIIGIAQVSSLSKELANVLMARAYSVIGRIVTAADIGPVSRMLSDRTCSCEHSNRLCGLGSPFEASPSFEHQWTSNSTS